MNKRAGKSRPFIHDKIASSMILKKLNAYMGGVYFTKILFKAQGG